MDKKLALPDFLKLLTNNHVPVLKAMGAASKVFKEYNTPALLVRLDDAKLQALGIEDKDLRKLVLAAIRRAGCTWPTRKLSLESDSSMQPAAGPSFNNPTSSGQTLITLKKKRYRDDDVSECLPQTPPDDGEACGNMDFNDVLDGEILRMKSTVVNRAPLLTVWAMIVAERLDFEREEALSIGSVYTEMNAIAKGLSLGIIDRGRKTEAEPVLGAQQPYVDLMGRRIPLYRTQLSKWRALVSGSPASPGTAFSYISRAFRQTTPYVVGALRLLAESYPPQELNEIGFSLYADFRPIVDGWGKRGVVRCERILSLRKKGTGDPSRANASDSLCDDEETALGQAGEPTRKKARLFSLDEYGHL